MRGPASIVPRYLFVFFLLLTGLLFFSSLAASTSISDLPARIEAVWLPTAVASVFVSFALLPKGRNARFVSVVQIIVVASAIFVSGSYLFDSLCAPCERGSESLEFPARTIVSVPDGALFASDSDRLTGIVSFNTSPGSVDDLTPPRLDVRFVDAAEYNGESGALTDLAGETLVLLPPDPLSSLAFRAPPFSRRFFDEVGSASTYLRSTRANPSRFVLTSVSVIAFAAACAFFSRVSRWRLMNLIVIVLMFRLLFLLFDLFTGELIARLIGAARSAQAVSQLPALLFFSVSLLLLMADFLFGRDRA